MSHDYIPTNDDYAEFFWLLQGLAYDEIGNVNAELSAYGADCPDEVFLPYCRTSDEMVHCLATGFIC